MGGAACVVVFEDMVRGFVVIWGVCACAAGFEAVVVVVVVVGMGFLAGVVEFLSFCFIVVGSGCCGGMGSILDVVELEIVMWSPDIPFMFGCGSNEAGAGDGRGTFLMRCLAFGSKIGKSACRLMARSSKCRSVSEDNVDR